MRTIQSSFYRFLILIVIILQIFNEFDGRMARGL